MYINIVVAFFAINYWSTRPFHLDLFIYGFITSIGDILGTNFLIKAHNCGPSGPISAVVSLTNVNTAII